MARPIDIGSCYTALQLSQSASLDDVKSSYKRLALKYHPDKNSSPDATAKFQEIGSAYKAIIDHIERPAEPSWSPHTGNFYPYDPYRGHEDDFFIDLEFFLFMFAFGYGRGNCPLPFDFRPPRPQKPQKPQKPRWGGETYAERAAREMREEKAEARERMWQEQQEKKARETAAARERAKKTEKESKAKKGATRAERSELFKVARQKQRATVFAAARGGRWEQVKKGIWEDGVDADGVEVLTGLEEMVPKPKEPKETLLHLAAKAGVMDIFKWLVDHGASPEARDAFLRTPFHLALQYGHLPLVNHILATFPPGSPDSQPVLSSPPKASLLRLAVESNKPDIVKIVINRFTIPESDVAKEWRRLKDPAFVNGFPVSRSYGGGRGRTEVHNPTGWKEIHQLLREYVTAFNSSGVPHCAAAPSEADPHPCHSPVEGTSCPMTSSSPNTGDFIGDKPTGNHTKPKRDKARRKRGTGHQHK